VELLSNLAWIAVALALWSQWLSQRRRGSARLPRMTLGVQVTALAVLTMILLPVISVSDDLQQSHNPAEIERTSVRSDQHLVRPDAAQPAPPALAFVISYFLLASPHTITFLRASTRQRTSPLLHNCVFASRPPPTA
jgi:hypothetical protein